MYDLSQSLGSCKQSSESPALLFLEFRRRTTEGGALLLTTEVALTFSVCQYSTDVLNLQTRPVCEQFLVEDDPTSVVSHPVRPG